MKGPDETYLRDKLMCHIMKTVFYNFICANVSTKSLSIIFFFLFYVIFSLVLK